MDWSEWAKQFQEPLAKVVLSLLGITMTVLGIVAAWLGIKAVMLVGELKKKIGLEKNQLLARIAVAAVEQKAPQSAGLNTSEEKKAAAVATMQTHAPKVDATLAEDLVESAVAEQKLPVMKVEGVK